MRRRWITAALPLALLLSAGSASADLAPSSRCKCGVPGVPTEGALAGVMLGGGALMLLIARKRRRGG